MENNWISVKDDLPELRERVLTATDDTVCICQLVDSKKITFHTDMGFETTVITHWQPLPQPPKK